TLCHDGGNSRGGGDGLAAGVRQSIHGLSGAGLGRSRECAGWRHPRVMSRAVTCAASVGPVPAVTLGAFASVTVFLGAIVTIPPFIPFFPIVAVAIRYRRS